MRPTTFLPRRIPLASNPVPRRLYYGVRFLSSENVPTLIKRNDIPAPHVGHIRILSLNNPRTRNAISRQLLSELSSEIRAIRQEVEDEAAQGETAGTGTRVLILASEVKEAFCAGADLKERKAMSREETNQFLSSLRSTFRNISTLPIPTMSAVSSVALGGGLELALSTDFRVFEHNATIGLPETRLGIIPGAGGTYRLRKLIGESKALSLILTGRTINGLTSFKLGIGDMLVKQSELDRNAEDREERAMRQVLKATLAVANKICEGGPGAVGAALRAVKEGTEEAEEREYENVVGMQDRDEALKAFAEKRPPEFKGQ